MRLALPVCVLCVLASLLARPVAAATFVVDRTDDDASATACTVMPNDCSLRGAIIAANAAPGADTVMVPAGTYNLTIKGVGEDMAATGDLDITDDLTLQGAGSGQTIIDGAQLGDTMNPPDRIIHIDPAGSGTLHVTISGVTVQNATTVVVSSVSSSGAGILNGSGCNPCSPVGSAVMLSDVAVQGNSSDGDGGGIANYGAMTIADGIVSGNFAGDVGGGIGQGDIGSLELHDTAVSGNTAASDGGGLYSGFLGTSGTVPAVTIDGCTFDGNTANRGGGLFRNGGTVTITNSTLSQNSADNTGSAGGAIHAAGGAVTANNATIAFNTGAGRGGGIYGIATLGNTILAGNSAPTGPDCDGSVASTGYNLIDVTCTISGDTIGNLIGQMPDLGPLADNGGPTRTLALLPGSPGIDAASPATPGSGMGACETIDQRGTSRPQPANGRCDIGAFELVSGGLTTTTTVPRTTSTSTTSTTTPPSTSTTTLPPAPSTCATAAAGPTFASIDCRLAALAADVVAATDLGALAARLLGLLGDAVKHDVKGEMSCRQGSRGGARRMLGPAIAKVAAFHRALRSRAAGSSAPALAREADAVQADMRRLRRALHCPADAPR